MTNPFSDGRAPPAAVRNTAAICDVIRRVLAPRLARDAVVLGIAEGSGYHAYAFAQAFPDFVWQPSDADADSCQGIADIVQAAQRGNLRPPVQLDVRTEPWPVQRADAITCINMIHISPWDATLALFRGAATLLARDSVLLTYGPYSVTGDFLAQSNVDFDQSLRMRNPTWGIRDVTDVQNAAADAGFVLDETIRMPANNLMLVFRRT